MGVARIYVTGALLRQAMAFPQRTEIVGASIVRDRYDTIELIVEHPDLKDETVEGAAPPLVTPTFQRQDPVVLVNWGQE